MAPLRLVVVLAAGLLLLPTATAATAKGELEAATLAVPSSARVETAGFQFLTAGAAPPQLEMSLSEVSIQRWGTSEVHVSTPSIGGGNRDIDQQATYASATIKLSAGAGDQLVAFRSTGPSVATLGPSEIRGVEGVRLADAMLSNEPSNCSIERYCLDATGVYEIDGSSIAAELIGAEFFLLLFGPTLLVQDGADSESFASGETSSSSAGPVSQREIAWVVVRAKSATGTVNAADSFLYSAAPTIRAQSLEFRDADGSVRVGALDYRATSDDVHAVGELVLTPGAVAPGTYNADGAPIYASSFTTRVAGDVESINLNAKPVFLDTPAKQAGFAAILAVLIGGIAYAWQHISFLGAALYTRLNKPDILDNDVRNRIYDIIRQHPGISAREVHRQSEQSWGTVVYHLRQLERHHLVVSRALGRTRNYYENHGKYRGMEVQLACLQSDRALVLARAIAGQPGITQEQLAAASGYPQPTTSYYVRKLKQAGLVEEQREGRYVKYVPHADLPRFISLSEQPDLSTPAASGVQA